MDLSLVTVQGLPRPVSLSPCRPPPRLVELTSPAALADSAPPDPGLPPPGAPRRPVSFCNIRCYTQFHVPNSTCSLGPTLSGASSRKPAWFVPMQDSPQSLTIHGLWA